MKKPKRNIRSTNQKALGFRSIAPAKEGTAYNLRMTKGSRNKRKPGMPKMPWEDSAK